MNGRYSIALTFIFCIIIVLDFCQGNEQPSEQLDFIPTQFTFHYRASETLRGKRFGDTRSPGSNQTERECNSKRCEEVHTLNFKSKGRVVAIADGLQRIYKPRKTQLSP